MDPYPTSDDQPWPSLDDVILTRSGSLDIGHRVWMTSLPEREDKLG